MKKVFKFILTSFLAGLIFAIPMTILAIFANKFFDIYMFLNLLLYGFAFTSMGVIIGLFDKNVAIKNSKYVKWNEFIKSNPVIILAILCSMFTIYSLINPLSEYLIFHYIKTEQYNKVIKVSKLLNKIYPQDCNIYSHLSYANFKKQNYDEAINYNKQQLECNPNFYPAHIRIAEIYFDNKDNLDNKYKNILDELDKSLKINNDSFVAHFGKQDIHFKMNDCKNGINDVENILRISDKKGAERYMLREKSVIIEESLPNNWKVEVLKNLSTCPNTNEKEELIKKIAK